MSTPRRLDEGIAFRAEDGSSYMPYDVFSRVSEERNLLRDALERITRCDYRGNEPVEQYIARTALIEAGLRKAA
jgi:hypothetical protein